MVEYTQILRENSELRGSLLQKMQDELSKLKQHAANLESGNFNTEQECENLICNAEQNCLVLDKMLEDYTSLLNDDANLVNQMINELDDQNEELD